MAWLRIVPPSAPILYMPLEIGPLQQSPRSLAFCWQQRWRARSASPNCLWRRIGGLAAAADATVIRLSCLDEWAACPKAYTETDTKIRTSMRVAGCADRWQPRSGPKVLLLNLLALGNRELSGGETRDGALRGEA